MKDFVSRYISFFWSKWRCFNWIFINTWWKYMFTRNSYSTWFDDWTHFWICQTKKKSSKNVQMNELENNLFIFGLILLIERLIIPVPSSQNIMKLHRSETTKTIVFSWVMNLLFGERKKMNMAIELRLFTMWQRQKKTRRITGKESSIFFLFSTSRRKKKLMSQFHRL